MPATDGPHLLAARWLALAEGDLVLAHAAGRDPDAPPRGAAFFAQQALEKALKSVLVWEQIDYPRTHDLSLLAGLVPSTWKLPLPADRLERLGDFAVDTRYPLDEGVAPVSRADADEALSVAAELVASIAERLEARGLRRLDRPG